MRGKLFRSEAKTFTAGQQFDFKTDFLAPARNMAVPEVCSINVMFTGTVGAISGGALGRDAAKLIDQVLFRDEEEIVNASGQMLRILQQVEYGNKQIDPADISSGATNTTYKYLLKIAFEPLDSRAARPRDFRIPLAHFLEGGQLLINTAAAVPTGWAAIQADWKVQLVARIKDGRVNELKSRRRIYEQVVNQQEFDYQANGSLRNVILGSKLTTTGYTSMATVVAPYSRTLEVPPAFDTAQFVEEYRQFSDSLGTNDEFVLATPGAIPFVVPNRGQKTGEMIDTKTFHLDLGVAAPASAKLLIDAVVDRTPNMAALTTGYGSPGELGQAIAKNGVVVSASGNDVPAKQMVSTLVRRLPVRIKKGTS